MRFTKGRILPLAVLIAASVWLAACHPPTTFPNGLDSSCFTQVFSSSVLPSSCDSFTEGSSAWTEGSNNIWTYTAWGSGTNCDLGSPYGIQSGTASNSYVYEQTGCFGEGGAPDDRLNWKHGDLTAVIYSREDDNGSPNLHVYCVGEESFYFGFAIPGSAFTDVASPPAKNTEVFASDACGGVWIKGYVLTTGEFQINIGNDGGKIDVMIFEGMPPNNIHFEFLDPGA